MFSRLFFGVRRPRRRVLGSEFAGEIVEGGTAVRDFSVGDCVFGTTGLRFGAHAEFVCVPERGRIARLPAGMRFQDAAPACDGAQYALNCLRAAGSLAGKKVLIYGASGAIGTAGVQLAKYFGAAVTAVCNTKNVELVRSLGADAVIDYMQEDFTKNGQTYDVIFDAVGKHSFKRCKASLKRGGSYLATDGLPNVLLTLATRVGKKRVKFPVGALTKNDVLFLSSLMEAKIYRPVVDRCYSFEHVIEAATYVETQQKTGNVVMIVS